MSTVDVHQTKAQLSRLFALAKGEPIARLVACKPKDKRSFGAMRGGSSRTASLTPARGGVGNSGKVVPDGAVR